MIVKLNSYLGLKDNAKEAIEIFEGKIYSDTFRWLDIGEIQE